MTCCCLARCRWWGLRPTWPYRGSRWWSRPLARPGWSMGAVVVMAAWAAAPGGWAAVAGQLALGGGVLPQRRCGRGAGRRWAAACWPCACRGSCAWVCAPVGALAGLAGAGPRRASLNCWRPTLARAMPCWCARPRAPAVRRRPRFIRESDAATACWCPAAGAGRWVDVLMLSHRDADHTGGAAAVLASSQGQRWQDRSRPSMRCRPCARHAITCGAALGVGWRGTGAAPHGRGPTTGSPNTAAACCAWPARKAPSPRAQAHCWWGHRGCAGSKPCWPLRSGQNRRPAGSAPWQDLVPPAFLDAVAPRTGLVGAGYRNPLATPAPEVLQRYAHARCPWWSRPAAVRATWSSAVRMGGCKATGAATGSTGAHGGAKMRSIHPLSGSVCRRAAFASSAQRSNERFLRRAGATCYSVNGRPVHAEI